MLTLLLAALLAEAPEAPATEKMKIDEVLSCAGDAPKCDASDWDLAQELVRRFDTKDLSSRLQRASGAQRRVLVFALYAAPSNPDVAKLMKKLSSDRDEEIAYYALNYRAKLCEKDALAKLVAPPYEPRGACQQWATTVSLVGQCQYMPGGALSPGVPRSRLPQHRRGRGEHSARPRAAPASSPLRSTRRRRRPSPRPAALRSTASWAPLCFVWWMAQWQYSVAGVMFTVST
ncbi:hypothetical protein HMI51_05335 [Corallococcus coralloides]|nr:hypothetical protein [Corallococcus coralloides]